VLPAGAPHGSSTQVAAISNPMTTGAMALLEGPHRTPLPVAVGPARGQPGQCGAGQHDAHHADQRPHRPRAQAQAGACRVEATCQPMSNKQHVGSWRCLGNGNAGVELHIGEPRCWLTR
jgi:hypothetical protein